MRLDRTWDCQFSPRITLGRRRTRRPRVPPLCRNSANSSFPDPLPASYLLGYLALQHDAYPLVPGLQNRRFKIRVLAAPSTPIRSQSQVKPKVHGQERVPDCVNLIKEEARAANERLLLPRKRHRCRDLLQRLKELVSADSCVGEDAAEGAALDIPGVDGNGDHIGAIGVREVVMTSLRTGEPPALPFEDPDQLAGADGRQPRTHAATVIRSISAGCGSGRPSSARTSR